MPLARKKQLIGNRSHQRFSTTFLARIEQAGHLIEVEVTDISVRGARIRAVASITSLVPGLPMRLMADGLMVDGLVTRRTGDEYGLHFHCDIEPLKVVRRNYRLPHAGRPAVPAPPQR